MRDFLKYVFASLTGTLIFFGLVLGGILLLLASVASLSSGRSPEPAVQDKTILVFDLSATISDIAPSDDGREVDVQRLLRGSGGKILPLSTILDCLDKAAADKRVVGLYLHGNLSTEGYGSGFAALREIREALLRFKASKKPIYAYNQVYSERDYYLASVADKIFLNPFGAIEMNGLASEMMFLGEAFKKYGVGIQVTRVGKYKSAVEPLLFDKMSPENREQTQKLLDDVWGEFVSGVATARQLTPDDLQRLANEKAILVGPEAVAAKLADETAYLDQVLGTLRKLSEVKDDKAPFRQVTLPAYARVSRRSLGLERTSRNIIAVVYAEGEIVDGAGSDGQIGGDRLAKELRRLRQDDQIKAVVLRVNSPGGSALASEVIRRELAETRAAGKPVVVSMGTVAASGGYWISTASDKIFAAPNTITGSIGVFGILPNIQKLAGDYGVKWDTAKTNRYADLGTITRPKTEDELKLIQANVDRIYDEFLTRVAEARKLPKETVQEIAQGRIWSGAEAKRLGLVDEFGGLEAAIQAAAELAKLGNDWKIAEYPKRRNLAEQLAKLLTDEEPERLVQGPVQRELEQLWAETAALAAFNDPLGVYARLPFLLRFN
ncbi:MULTISPECIES: signal peptide peptidase SppA [Chloracidobacterium]|jgi:protease-4|uniref:Signal peptide peptidase A, Serine peptidase, MEROPS family S49 n=1 Tax=Chloracidobacterium thermophilum (strain B) TaxID=981222 RepID=G2LFW0_CHLTF|nr:MULTISPECIES: signal peptide peptidase SppA [Chloracidobacterium]AEP11754.1 signal peptide peptidase A, Serine peptidase, MEROPS family S49 [Chloracidobacterium thermophilum B]QUV79626.1 signal peptide peptidase SppA [Chloracidobacterium thermophilum]QUV82664.1 signal peptide peptidase SppA [Chloracidobacterium sp. D]